MCNQRPSHSFSHSLRNTQRAIHLHMHISINVWSTPMLRPSHPSTVHDELLSQLVTCKMKNIKQNAGVTVITPKGSFKQNCFSSIHCILHLKSCIMLLLYCIIISLLHGCLCSKSIRASAHSVQYFFAFDLTDRCRSRQTWKHIDQIRQITESEKKKVRMKKARFRLCDMSRFCQCQDYRHPLGFGDGSIHCQRWIIVILSNFFERSSAAAAQPQVNNTPWE